MASAATSMSTCTERLAAWGRAAAKALGAAALCGLLAAAAPAARADTVVSMLGDFTINQYVGLQLSDDGARVHVVVVYGQLPALRELRDADTDADGVTTRDELDAHVMGLAPWLAESLVLTVDGVRVPLRAADWTSSRPAELAGASSLRFDINYHAALPRQAAGAPARRLVLANRNFPGRVGWREMAVTAHPGLQVFDTNAYGTSLTRELGEVPAGMPAAGPLDEREIHLRYTGAVAPAGAVLLAPRPEPLRAAAEVSPMAAEGAWLGEQTRRVVRLMSAPDVPLHVLIVALAAAMALGALHALSPGHGKSVVGAYLVGSRGTPRHAVFLGVTVTITHTLMVFVLGALTLFASRTIVPERLFPILSLLSGLLVVAMGLTLLVQRWKEARLGWLSQHAHAHDHGHAHHHDHGHHHHHPHDGHHDHGTAPQAHGAALTHSHGGTTHTHLPPSTAGDAVTWRGLLTLGVSGGLLPCPSAMVLLLASVAINKTLVGLALVVAFSVGLALTLSAIGLVFLYARAFLDARSGRARWPHLLPLLSAASITLLGGVLCIGTLISHPV